MVGRKFQKKASKVAEELLERVTQGQAKFYLVQSSGPTSYVLREEDEEQSKYKVLLGDPNRCSCAFFASHSICVHTVFVLVKILRVPKDDPVCWQHGLIEREIDQVLRTQLQRASQKRTTANKHHTFLRKRSGERRLGIERCNQEDNEREEVEGVERKPVEEGDVCPICQEDLPTDEKQLETFAFCKTGCGNTLHIKCMKIWAEHQSSVGNSIRCPLCRVDWGPTALVSLKRQENKVRSDQRTQRKQRLMHRGIRCSACKAFPIVGERYKCLVCPSSKSADLCSECYSSCQNVTCKRKRHPFIVKAQVNQDWMSAKPIENQAGVEPVFMENLMTREFTAEDYDLLLSLDDPFARSRGTVQARTFPELLVKHMKSSLISGCPCSLCERVLDENTSRKVLPCCDRVLHEACAFEVASSQGEKNSSCPLCDQAVFPGLATQACTSVNESREQSTQSQQDPNADDVGASLSFGVSGSSLFSATLSNESLSEKKHIRTKPVAMNVPKTSKVSPTSFCATTGGSHRATKPHRPVEPGRVHVEKADQHPVKGILLQARTSRRPKSSRLALAGLQSISRQTNASSNVRQLSISGFGI